MTVAAYTLVPALGIGPAITQLNATPSVRETAGQYGVATMYMVDGTVQAPINMAITNFLPVVRVPTNAIIKKLELGVDAYPSTSLTLSIGVCFSNGGSGALVGASPASGFSDGTSVGNLSQYSTTAQTSAKSQVVSFSFFAYNLGISTTVPLLGMMDVTFNNLTGNSATDGYYVPSASVKPLWQAIMTGGLTSAGVQGTNAAVGVGGTTATSTSATVGNGWTTCLTDPGGFFDICIASNTVGVNTSAVNLTLRAWYTVAAA